MPTSFPSLSELADLADKALLAHLVDRFGGDATGARRLARIAYLGGDTIVVSSGLAEEALKYAERLVAGLAAIFGIRAAVRQNSNPWAHDRRFTYTPGSGKAWSVHVAILDESPAADVMPKCVEGNAKGVESNPGGAGYGVIRLDEAAQRLGLDRPLSTVTGATRVA